MTIQYIDLGIVFIIIGIFVIASIIMAIVNVRREFAERKQHFQNMAWPFRVVETMDGKFRVQQYVNRKKYYEWVEANCFDHLGEAQRYCIEHTAILMKNRYGTMTREDLEAMNSLNRVVKQVVRIDDIKSQVRSFMKKSDTLPYLDAKDIDYITSKEFVTSHGDK